MGGLTRGRALSVIAKSKRSDGASVLERFRQAPGGRDGRVSSGRKRVFASARPKKARAARRAVVSLRRKLERLNDAAPGAEGALLGCSANTLLRWRKGITRPDAQSRRLLDLLLLLARGLDMHALSDGKLEAKPGGALEPEESGESPATSAWCGGCGLKYECPDCTESDLDPSEPANVAHGQHSESEAAT